MTEQHNGLTASPAAGSMPSAPIVLTDEAMTEPDYSRPDSNPDSGQSTEWVGNLDLPRDRPVVALLQRRSLLPTGCCYDDRMKLHVNADFNPGPHHPEDPRRIEEIFNAFKQAGLIFTGPEQDLPHIVARSPNRYMWRIAARQASRDEVCTVHLPEHYEWVAGLADKSYAELRAISIEMDQGRQSLYVGSLSFLAALLSAGGAIDTCRQVVESHVKNAFAIIRPPGHHAESDAPMGFCFFNNVPIAVKICQTEYPDICRKVLILDWDVHHGNGIQNIFYRDPNVLYISVHVYLNGEFYPGRPDNPMVPDGGIEHCGSGAGLGKNVNIGWHAQGMGDGEYMAVFQKIIMPIAKEFSPDLVVVSAGFDAADGDELGGCFVTPSCYAHMTHMLMSLADGKVAVCLEGGYDLTAISNSAVAVARTLMGEPPPKMTIPSINKEAAKLLLKVQAHQAPFWDCMRPGVVDVLEAQSMGGSRLHDVIRNAQRQTLQQKHMMVPLYIQRDGLFRSYENQVLVSPVLNQSRRILVIFHDPPKLVAQADGLDASVEAHNAWVIDGVTQFIDWAADNRFGIMDVNVPKYISRPEDHDALIPKMDETTLQAQMQELVCYLWDNYLQLCDDVEDIFLLGIGDAHMGIKALLSSRNCKAHICGIVSFVTGSLRAIKAESDPDLSAWYRDNSRVYVDSDHPCWTEPEYMRKVQKRRYGTVIRSSTSGLQKMLQAHAVEAQDWMLSRTSSHGDTTDEEAVVVANDAELHKATK